MTIKITFAYLRVTRPFLASLFGLMIFQALSTHPAPAETASSPKVVVHIPAH